MRRSVFAATALLALAAAVPAAQADPTVCRASCEFHCHSGDTVFIKVTGPSSGSNPARVQGVVSCGTVTIHCIEETGACARSGVTSTNDSTGLCDLTEGKSAVCWTVPARKL